MNWRKEAIRVLGAYIPRKASLQSMAAELSSLELQTHLGSTGDETLNALVMHAELIRARKETELWLRAMDNALDALNQEERELLTRLYISPWWGSLKEILDRTGLAKTTLYRKRDNALRKFTLAMYGKE